ncbi:MAG: cytochrome c oxidase subunit 3 family protein [Thermodesulfobacteriota bacterium]
MSSTADHAESHAHGHGLGPIVTHEAAKLGIWLFLGTEILLFGGLFTAYAIFRAKFPEMFYEQHLKLDLKLGTINTIILIFSSFTMALAVLNAQRRNQKMLIIFLIITIICAFGFGINKYFEYMHKFENHIYPDTNIFFALYFMMTGLHMIHVFIGIVVLSSLVIMTMQGRFVEGRPTPVEVGGLYWHLVDLVWIYLFPLLYLIG